MKSSSHQQALQPKHKAPREAATNTIGKNAAAITDNRNSVQKKENKTGLPDNLKSGIENLGGMSMDHVKVHYNSAMPAQMQAHAYAQGTDIHVAPGQEKHLPHEAWHVVQQAKGRVKPTMNMGGVPVNNNKGLEKEADHMGAKALQTVQRYGPDPEDELPHLLQRKESETPSQAAVVQRSGKGGGGKKNNKKQEKQKKAAADKARRDQSQKDRNAFRALQYETTSKRNAKAKQELAKELKGNLAHGFGGSDSGKQGKTKKQLKELNKKLKQQMKQKEADKAKDDWLNRDDRDDQGGAGFGHGVLV